MKSIFIKLTLIIPTYNRLPFLKKSLYTYLKTKRKDVKFLILDNYSNDGTRVFIKRLSKIDKRVSFFFQKKNKFFNRNTYDGFRMTKSPYAMWLGDDDLMCGDYINKVINIFDKYPNVGIIHNRVNKLKKKNLASNYDIYNQGFDSVKAIVNQGSAFPGLSYRMSFFNLKKYPKGKKYIYSLHKMNLLVAKESQVVIMNDAGLIEQDINLNAKIKTLKKIKEQGRDYSMNIDEIIHYIVKIFSREEAVELCYIFKNWPLNISKILDEKHYNFFLKKISRTLGAYCIIFLFILIFKRFKFIIIYYIIRNILNLNFFIFNILNLIFYLKKFSKKYLYY